MIKYELINTNSYPNINLYCRFDGESFSGWKFETTEGYVMYNPEEIYYEIDFETEEEIPVFYYYTQYITSAKYDIESFPYIAISRDLVNEQYIF